MTLSGPEFRAMRESAGLTQNQLAEAIGMARETVGAMERGVRPIHQRTALAVSNVVKCRMEETLRFLKTSGLA